VKIDPAAPVPSWGLSAVGRTCTETLANTGWLSGTTQIISSEERKAIETAEIIAGRLNVAVGVLEAMHENDRSAKDFLPPNEFEASADQFFAQPLSASGDGNEQSMPNYASSVRLKTSWLVIEQAMCFS
jgi:broad specificity phosphatase PhoE